MKIRNKKDITLYDLLLYAQKYWLWVAITGVIAGFSAYSKFLFSYKYTAVAKFAIVGGETNRMQEITEKLSGVNVGMYNESERVFRKYKQYFASQKKGHQVLASLKKSGQVDLVQHLLPNNLSLPEKALTLFGLEKVVNRENLNTYFTTIGVRALMKAIGHKESFDQTFRRTKHDAFTELLNNDEYAVSLINANIWIQVNNEDFSTIYVYARSHNPETSFVIANLAIDHAMNDVMSSDLQEVKDSKTYIESQLEETRGRIKEIETHLNRAKQLTKGSQKSRDKLESHLRQLEDQLLSAQSKLTQTRELLKRENYGNSASVDYMRRRNIEKLEREQIYWRAKVKSLNEIIARVKSQSPDNHPEQLAAKLNTENLERQKEFEFQQMASLQKLQIELNVNEVSIRNKVRVLDRANKATTSKQNLSFETLLSYIIIAMSSSIFLFIAKESVAPQVKSRDDVEQCGFLDFGSVPDFSLLGNLSNLRNRFANLASKKQDYKIDSPVYIPNNSPQDYIFGQIRSKLIHAIETSEFELKLVAITSPNQGEGKSLISGKLAYSIAKANFKVLLIDGDPIRKDLSHTVNFEENKGLREVLQNKSNPEQNIIKGVLNENLDFMPAGQGRGSVSDILITKESVSFFKYCRQHYDIVIVDTPALLIAPDALLFCRMADVTTMILSAGFSKVRDVERANSDLRNNGVETIGCIMNRSDSVVKYVYTQPKRRKKSTFDVSVKNSDDDVA